MTDNLLETAVFDFDLKYDTFEPFDCSEIQTEELNKYPFVVAELGIISEKTLTLFLGCKKPCLLILAGAETKKKSFPANSLSIKDYFRLRNRGRQ